MKTEKQMTSAAQEFAARCAGRGYEKGDSQVFWTELLTEVFGIKNQIKYIKMD